MSAKVCGECGERIDQGEWLDVTDLFGRVTFFHLETCYLRWFTKEVDRGSRFLRVGE